MLIFSASIEQVVLPDTVRESPGRDNRNHPPFIVVTQRIRKDFIFLDKYLKFYINCLSSSENIANFSQSSGGKPRLLYTRASRLHNPTRPPRKQNHEIKNHLPPFATVPFYTNPHTQPYFLKVSIPVWLLV